MKKISLVLVAVMLISVLSVVPKGKVVDAYSIDDSIRYNLISGYNYRCSQVGDEIDIEIPYVSLKKLTEDWKLMISLDDESSVGAFSPKIIELSSDDYDYYSICKELKASDYISNSDPDGEYRISLIDSDNNTIISSFFTKKDEFGIMPNSEVEFDEEDILETVATGWKVGMCPTTSHNINDAVAICAYKYGAYSVSSKFIKQPIGQYDFVLFDNKGEDIGSENYTYYIYTDDNNQLPENNIDFEFRIKDNDGYVYAYAYDYHYKNINSSTYPILFAEDKTTPITSFDAFGTAKNPDGEMLYVYRLNILDKSKFNMIESEYVLDNDYTYAYSKINGGILNLYRDSSGYGLARVEDIYEWEWDLEPANPFSPIKEDDPKDKDINPTDEKNVNPTPKPETKKNVSVSTGGITKVNTSSKGTATLTGVNKKSKKITVGSVKVGGFKYPITDIAKNSFKNAKATEVTVKFSKKNITIKKDAFKNSKVKTLSFKSFTKASQIKMDKNALKSSKIKTIKVSKKIFNNKKQKNAFKKTLKKAGLRNYKLKKI